MVFWEIEVKPGKPYNHTFEKNQGSLHVTQATLGIGSAAKKRKSTVVQCKVGGDKRLIPICSLLPDKIESCSLDLQFEALEGEVIFSVFGPGCVHLTGFYLGQGDDTDTYGEDIGESGPWSKMFFAEMNIKEDDPVKVDDLEMFPPPRSNSGVVIEEIEDESIATAKSNEGKSDKKIAKEKKKKKAAEEKTDKKIQTESKKKEKDGVHNGAGIKRKIDSITQDGEAERASEKSEDSSKPSTEIGQEKSEKTKKKKKVRA